MLNQLTNFDANASWGLDRGLIDEAMSLIGARGTTLNPSSIHTGGQRARALLDEAREEVRALIKAPSDTDVVFTSGATESNNLALHWIAKELPGRADVLTSSVEHHSVLEPIELLRSADINVQVLSASEFSSGALDRVLSACLAPKLLVSLQHSNNESGIVYPIAEIISQLRAKRQVWAHSDIVQSAGKVLVTWDSLGVDAVSISGHKLGAPSGIGALVVQKGRAPKALIVGGPQEKRVRAGTENVLGAVCLGIAAHRARIEFDLRVSGMRRARDCVREILESSLSEIEFPFVTAETLPNTLSVRIGGIRADDLVVAADLAGVALSSGAACSSGKPDPSHVLIAHGMSVAQATQTIRVSVLPSYKDGEVERAAAALVSAVQRMRGKP